MFWTLLVALLLTEGCLKSDCRDIGRRRGGSGDDTSVVGWVLRTDEPGEGTSGGSWVLRRDGSGESWAFRRDGSGEDTSGGSWVLRRDGSGEDTSGGSWVLRRDGSGEDTSVESWVLRRDGSGEDTSGGRWVLRRGGSGEDTSGGSWVLRRDGSGGRWVLRRDGSGEDTSGEDRISAWFSNWFSDMFSAQRGASEPDFSDESSSSSESDEDFPSHVGPNDPIKRLMEGPNTEEILKSIQNTPILKFNERGEVIEKSESRPSDFPDHSGLPSHGDGETSKKRVADGQGGGSSDHSLDSQRSLFTDNYWKYPQYGYGHTNNFRLSEVKEEEKTTNSAVLLSPSLEVFVRDMDAIKRMMAPNSEEEELGHIDTDKSLETRTATPDVFPMPCFKRIASDIEESKSVISPNSDSEEEILHQIERDEALKARATTFQNPSHKGFARDQEETKCMIFQSSESEEEILRQIERDEALKIAKSTLVSTTPSWNSFAGDVGRAKTKIIATSELEEEISSHIERDESLKIAKPSPVALFPIPNLKKVMVKNKDELRRMQTEGEVVNYMRSIKRRRKNSYPRRDQGPPGFRRFEREGTVYVQHH